MENKNYTLTRSGVMILRKILPSGLTWIIVLGAVLLLSQKEMDLRLNFNTADIIPKTTEDLSSDDSSGGFAAAVARAEVSTSAINPQPLAMNTSLLAGATKASGDNLANTYSNMTYHQKGNGTMTLKRKRQLAYVKRFAVVAKSEMKKYGIPASITLAQGLIESNAGDSRLSRQNNNHFGIKCFSKTCKKGHCSNFTDDSHKDFFRKYDNVWDSYRAHSIMLQKKRYRGLKQYGKDYKKWAHGLKKAGYATDPRYAEKLIYIIEELNLQQYD